MTFDDGVGVGGDGEGWDDEDADWGDLDDCKSSFCSNATMQALSNTFNGAARTRKLVEKTFFSRFQLISFI